MKIKLRLSKVAIVFGLLLLAANLFLYTRTIVLGDQLSHLEKKIRALTLENNDLEKKLATVTSIEQLSENAKIMGFSSKTNTLYFNNLFLAQIQDHE